MCDLFVWLCVLFCVCLVVTYCVSVFGLLLLVPFCVFACACLCMMFPKNVCVVC